MIPELPFDDIKIIRKFPSRKNSVFLVERSGWRMVLKMYASDRMDNEAAALRSSRKAGIAVPEVIEAGDRALLLELVPGRAVNDYLESPDMEQKVLDVAGWLAGFHRAFRSGDEVLVKSDAIFKNFIVFDRVYGIDFEMSHRGTPEEDVGEALAYLLDTDPMFTEEKIALGNKFIDLYEKRSGITLEDIEGYIALALRDAAKFRPGQTELLLKKAGEIEASRPFIRGRR